mgnify:CR=1 FL=1
MPKHQFLNLNTFFNLPANICIISIEKEITNKGHKPPDKTANAVKK